MKKWDSSAVILAAIFILWPLYCGETQSFIHTNRNYGGSQTPNPGEIIGWLTLGVLAFQAWIFWRQAEIFDKQTTLTHQNYLLTHRPKLRVRNIVIRHGMFERNQPISGQFFVDNIGGTNAYVTESHCEFLWNVNSLPMERPYEGRDGNNPIQRGRLIVGSVGITALFNSFPNRYPDAPPPGNDPLNRAYFIGWIEYVDDTGLRRRTIFCREFLQRDGSARFWPVKDDPDYEYEQ